MFVKMIRKLLLVLLLTPVMAQAMPEIQHWVTDNGVNAYFVPSDELPIIDVRLVFDAGSARDGDKYGLAVLTNGLLFEGVAGMSAQKIAEQFESVGAEYGNGALKDMAWVNLRSLRADKYSQPALDLMARVISHPGFPKKAWQRELNRMKVSLKARQQDPSTVADEAFQKAIYGNHPYAHPSDGTEVSLEKISRKDVKAFYRNYYVASNATLAITGKLTRSDAEKLAVKLTAGLKRGKPPAAIPPVKPLEKSQEIRIPFPSRQSTVLMGQPGMWRGDADYFTLYLANHPFGGSGFASRLMQQVREKRGLVYSVYSYFIPMRQAGPFEIGFQTRSDQTKQALGIVKDELKKYVADGPTKDELESSRKNITGGFPLRIDSNKKIVEYLAMIGFYHLPLDYLQKFNQTIDAITLKQVNDAIKRRMHPDKMVTVIVGPLSDSGK